MSDGLISILRDVADELDSRGDIKNSEWVEKAAGRISELKAELKQERRDFREAWKQREELRAKLEAVKALRDDCVQYQEYYGPDDMRPPDDTVYLKMPRDKLDSIIKEQEDE